MSSVVACLQQPLMKAPDLEALCPCTQQAAYIKTRHDGTELTVLVLPTSTWAREMPVCLTM